MASRCRRRDSARRVIGLSLVEAMAALAAGRRADEHVALAETYKLSILRGAAAGRVEEPLFDGIAELLDALEADGWLLAVATGKSDRGLAHCLELPRHRGALRLAADRRPPSVQAASVDGAAGDGRGGRGAGDDHRDRRHRLRHGHGARRRRDGHRRWLGLSRSATRLLAAGAMAVAGHAARCRSTLIAGVGATSMADEDLWKRRFLIFMLRPAGRAGDLLLGVAIAYTDLLREGGWPIVGAIVAIVGAVDAVFAPRLLKKVWEQQDRERRVKRFWKAARCASKRTAAGASSWTASRCERPARAPLVVPTEALARSDRRRMERASRTRSIRAPCR